jgi:hypothetical protein
MSISIDTVTDAIIGKLDAENKALEAEVERLRTALTRLLEANATRDHEGMSIDDWNAEILRAEEALEPAEEA